MSTFHNAALGMSILPKSSLLTQSSETPVGLNQYWYTEKIYTEISLHCISGILDSAW